MAAVNRLPGMIATYGHDMVPVEWRAPHRTFRCTICDLVLSGVTRRDAVCLAVFGLCRPDRKNVTA